MKRILIALAFAAPFVVTAQNIDRSKAPKPGPAPKISIQQPATFVLPNGLKVFVVQNSKLPRVSATLTLDIEPIVEGNKTGYTQMAGSLMRRGAAGKNKAQLDEAIDFLGGSVGTSATSASASGLSTNFDKIFDLMAQVVLKPTFDAAELEKIRKQALSGLEASKDEPETIANNVVSRLMYGESHPYGDIETEATLNAVTIADIKKFYGTYWKPNVAYLVFVGDITPAKAKALAEKHFGKWAKGVVPKPVYKAPATPNKTVVAIIDRPSAVQSLITIAAPIALKPGAADEIPSSVMNNILGGGFSGRLFANLREKYAFTYGAYSNLSSDKLVGNFQADASVRNEKTDSAIGQFLHEFNRIRNEAMPADEVDRMKNYLSGSFARSLEQPGTIASFALNVARYGLPKDYYQNYLTNLAAVNPATVQAMAKKYVVPGQQYIVIVGKAKEIAEGLEKYGEVKYFDMYGRPTAAPKKQSIPDGLTGKAVIEKFIEVSGAKNGVNGVTDIDMKGTATVQGQALQLSTRYITGKAYSNVLSFGAMKLFEQVYADGKYTQKQQGQEVPGEADDIESAQAETAIIAEIFYLANGATFNLTGIEKVEGKDAYVVEVKTKAGREVTFYYDVASGLKVKQSEVSESPQGSVEVSTLYTEYKTFNGIQIPVRGIMDQGVKIEFNYTEVKVNVGLKAEDFK
jgi:predicted Zn-dependent peptidase